MKRLRGLLMRTQDGGASAVEFALVAPVLFLLLFGIIDYGLWFSDTLGVRQGVREAARQGVVANFGTSSCTLSGATGDANSKALMCTAQDRIGATTGDPAIKVIAPNGWVRGAPLIVCAQVKDGISGIVPLPKGQVIQSKVEMSIENAVPGTQFSGGQETAPVGSDWSWCS